MKTVRPLASALLCAASIPVAAGDQLWADATKPLLTAMLK